MLRGEPVAITVAAFDAKSTPLEQIRQLFTSDSTVNSVGVNILILNYCDDAIIDFIARKVPVVDCMVRP